MPSTILRCFSPFIDKKAKVLILGTMPGPTALAKQEYYGFAGNHFWKIMFRYFKVEPTTDYDEKRKLLKDNRIALWDVFGACERESALDNDIQNAEINPIPELLKKYPEIKTILLNSRTAEKTFRKHFPHIKIPAHYLPSTSPAHAGLSFDKKYELWAGALDKALSCR